MIDLIRFDANPAKRLSERLRAQTLATGPHVLLETCDRLELYKGDAQPDRLLLRHLAGVAAGLESPLPGEKAIQGQVKAAFLAAQSAQSLSPGLHALFQNALAIAKRLRSSTAIDRGSITHAGAVAQLLRDRGLGASDEGILLLGVNEINESILRFLAGGNASGLILANRNQEKARVLAERYGARWGNLNCLPAEIPACRVVITCSSAPHYIIHPRQLVGRSGQPLLIFDLAAPPDVHPAVGELPGVELLGLRTIENLMHSHLKDRFALLPAAFAALETELDHWQARLQKRSVYLERL